LKGGAALLVPLHPAIRHFLAAVPETVGSAEIGVGLKFLGPGKLTAGQSQPNRQNQKNTHKTRSQWA